MCKISTGQIQGLEGFKMKAFWNICDWLGWFNQREIKLVGLEMTADKWLMHQ